MMMRGDTSFSNRSDIAVIFADIDFFISFSILKVMFMLKLEATRSNNQGWRPYAWGPRVSMCCTKKSIFRNNCATLLIIKPRGYTQICVELLPYMENGRESPVQFRQNYIIFDTLNVKITFYYPVHV